MRAQHGTSADPTLTNERDGCCRLRRNSRRALRSSNAAPAQSPNCAMSCLGADGSAGQRTAGAGEGGRDRRDAREARRTTTASVRRLEDELAGAGAGGRSAARATANRARRVLDHGRAAREGASSRQAAHARDFRRDHKIEELQADLAVHSEALAAIRRDVNRIGDKAAGENPR